MAEDIIKKKGILNKIICADVIDGLKQIPDDMVHLTFTSSPYNVLERSGSYDKHDDNLPYEEYLQWLKHVFTHVYDKTVSGGRCVINIDAMTNRQDDNEQEYIRCIYAHVYKFMTEIGWKFRTEICWIKSEAVGKKTAWGSFKSASNPVIRRNHEYLIVFSKDKWKLDSDVESDLTRSQFEKYTLSTWDIKPETRKLSTHPCPFPEELAKRVIKLFSFPQQIILDPFNGTGTTCKVAYEYNRHYIGIDNSKKYCKFAEGRIAVSIANTEIDLDDGLKLTKGQRKKKEAKLLDWERDNVTL
jgi:modification methylase